MKRLSLVRVVVIATLCWGLATGNIIAQASCGACTPAQMTHVTGLSGTYSVCIETDDGSNQMSIDERDGIKEGIEQYWDSYFAEADFPLDFTVSFASNGQCSADIRIRLQAGLFNATGHMAEADTTADGRNSGVRIDPLFLGQYGKDTWKNLGAHEIGHILGFDDVAEYCNDWSVMVNPISTGPLTGIQCGDSVALSQRYPADPGGGVEEDFPSEYEEDCWDTYFVVYHYYWSGEDWVLYDTDYYFLGTHCEPPDN